MKETPLKPIFHSKFTDTTETTDFHPTTKFCPTSEFRPKIGCLEAKIGFSGVSFIYWCVLMADGRLVWCGDFGVVNVNVMVSCSLVAW